MNLSDARKQSLQSVSTQKEAWADNAPAPRALLTFSYGLNENITPTLNECTQGYNFDLDFNRPSFISRAPFDLAATAPNAAAITSFMQLINRANVKTTLVVAGTIVYLWDGALTFTNKGTITAAGLLRSTYWSLGDYLVISDVGLQNVVKTWDGTTFANMTTGLASPLIAKYAIVHASRVWLFNITYNGVNFPHMILACKFEDPTVWDNALRGGPSTVGGGVFATGLEAFYLLVPDEKPINGVTLYQNVLVISTLGGRMWQLSGTSGKDFQFQDFYETAPAIGDESLRSIGNDVLFVRQGGAIALLYSTQNFGNVLAADLSHWLPITTKNLSQINAIVYDVLHQRVLIFVPNKVLVLFKRVMGQNASSVGNLPSPWGVYITGDACGFNTSHAVYIQNAASTDYTVYFGDSTGRIFNMYGVGAGDAGASSIDVYRRSRHIGSEVVKPWPWTEENITGHVRYQRISPNVSLSLIFDWDDEYNQTISSVMLKGPALGSNTAYFGGPYYFGGLFYFGGGSDPGRVSSLNIEPGGKGPGFYLTLSSSVIAPFQVDAVELD